MAADLIAAANPFLPNGTPHRVGDWFRFDLSVNNVGDVDISSWSASVNHGVGVVATSSAVLPAGQSVIVPCAFSVTEAMAAISPVSFQVTVTAVAASGPNPSASVASVVSFEVSAGSADVSFGTNSPASREWLYGDRGYVQVYVTNQSLSKSFTLEGLAVWHHAATIESGQVLPLSVAPGEIAGPFFLSFPIGYREQLDVDTDGFWQITPAMWGRDEDGLLATMYTSVGEHTLTFVEDANLSLSWLSDNPDPQSDAQPGWVASSTFNVDNLGNRTFDTVDVVATPMAWETVTDFGNPNDFADLLALTGGKLFPGMGTMAGMWSPVAAQRALDFPDFGPDPVELSLDVTVTANKINGGGPVEATVSHPWTLAPYVVVPDVSLWVEPDWAWFEPGFTVHEGDELMGTVNVSNNGVAPLTSPVLSGVGAFDIDFPYINGDDPFFGEPLAPFNGVGVAFRHVVSMADVVAGEVVIQLQFTAAELAEPVQSMSLPIPVLPTTFITPSRDRTEMPGSCRMVFADVHISGTYEDGGVSFPSAAFGIETLDWAWFDIASDGLMVTYNHAEDRLQVWRPAAEGDPLEELPLATPVDLTVRALIVGV